MTRPDASSAELWARRQTVLYTFLVKLRIQNFLNYCNTYFYTLLITQPCPILCFSKQQKYDCLWKLRRLSDCLRLQYTYVWHPTEHLAQEEVTYFGQCITKKQKILGIKSRATGTLWCVHTAWGLSQESSFKMSLLIWHLSCACIIRLLVLYISSSTTGNLLTVALSGITEGVPQMLPPGSWEEWKGVLWVELVPSSQKCAWKTRGGGRAHPPAAVGNRGMLWGPE